MLLRGGPGDGHVVRGGGENVLWQARLYEATSEVTLRHGHDLRVYQHRPDCCEQHGRGSEDKCE
ncbi:hypothetical protein [Micromonospora sp. U21]|uniref:hypothetical protein n=1 Tax=Micromonospora sp. U21 TaxID=2824899 RepID=UPI0027DE4823|nr:hypothetical protein [Micromonospora sp. U21]